MTQAAPAPSRSSRIPALDIARTAALLAMAIYHFVYDLELFGYLPFGTASTGGWRILALATAGSFLFLAGLSLVLAHGRQIRWRGFWIRFVKIAGAAALITLATWVAVPDAFIFFGILHAIALCSLIGLGFLRAPDWLLLAVAIAVFWIASQPGWAAFDPWVFWWSGLQAAPIRSVDYVPIFPWLAPFLLGMSAGKLGHRFDLWDSISTPNPPTWAWRLGAPGRHSLILYLVHQPVLISAIWLVTQVM